MALREKKSVKFHIFQLYVVPERPLPLDSKIVIRWTIIGTQRVGIARKSLRTR
jgi:hypothetical protein